MSAAPRVSVPLPIGAFLWYALDHGDGEELACAVTPERTRAEALVIARNGLVRREGLPVRPLRATACGRVFYGSALAKPGTPPCASCLALLATGSTVATPHAGPAVARAVGGMLAAMRGRS